ncbi:ras-domain-containing protein [Crepidotus variabilis]|uniref:Ras-domain-containing protein n=1 Tax=Crepidotus variabilis TaxID=179855 RepID=A0A9P6JL54_9AGAR|nr:ras-domain-containing protein [Crepidotus variabilis]
MAGLTWHYVFKFIITGDAAVGKSSLLIRLTDQRFLANPDPTLGVEFGSKLITLPEDGKVVKLQCWDTAGTESFRAITRSYYRGAAGCLLVYDVTSRKSFENVRNWLADVREHADPHVSCILVGNKVDLCDPSPTEASTSTSSSPPLVSHTKAKSTTGPKAAAKGKAREVPYAEAEQFAKDEGLLFVEASAKSGVNVEQAFVNASVDILEKIKKGIFDDNRSPGVKSSKPNTNLTLEGTTASSSCCSS